MRRNCDKDFAAAADDAGRTAGGGFSGTGMTVGPHPMKYHRASMKRQGVLTASELNAAGWDACAGGGRSDRAAEAGNGEGVCVSEL